MSKHTPGPWTTWQNEAEGLDRHVISAHESEGPFWQIGVAWAYDEDNEAAANARLIAAAPDLLEAARAILEAYHDDNWPSKVALKMDKLTVAIIKAAGEPL